MKTLGIITIVILVLLAWLYTSDDKTPGGADPEAWAAYVEGNDLLSAFKYPQAQEALLKSVAIDSNCSMAWAALAEVYGRMNQRNRSLEAGQRADDLVGLIKDDKRRGLVELRLANLGMHDCDYDSLLAFCVETSPEDVLVLASRAGRAARDGNLEEAAEIWLHCLEINPNYAQAYNELGYNAAARGSYDKAIKHMRTYAYVASDLANPHDSMGDILSFVGRYEEAIQEYRRALEIDPDFVYSMVNIARVYLALGNIEEGKRILEQVREEAATPGAQTWINGILMDNLFLYGTQEDLKKHAELFVASIDNPDLSARLRAFILAGSGDVDAGVALIDSNVATQRASAEDGQLTERQSTQYHSAMAIIYGMNGDAENAVDQWELSLDFGPDLVNEHALTTGWTLYAESLLQVERHQEALELARRMLRINPRLIRPLLIRARAALELGETMEARETIERLKIILANADDDIPVQESFAELLEAIGE